jgi:hypothetical protein
VTVRRLVSQPSLGLPLQSAHPAAHVGTQLPLWHDVEPLALVHALPQAPQFASVDRLVSHPLLGCASQSANPGVQAPMTHAPEVQLSAAFA